MIGFLRIPGSARRPAWPAALLVAAIVLSSTGAAARTAVATRAAVAPVAIKRGGTLKIVTELGALWSCNFSPFVPPVNATPDSWGFIYEPLYFVNGFAKPGMPVETGMLATSYRWGAGARTLTFTLRPGVRWSDGQPLTAADVVFTFNMIKKYPALDLAGAWQVLTSVAQQGTDKVVMTLKPGAVPSFPSIAEQTYIVAQHIWSRVGNPTTYVDKAPVGTGPVLMQQCTPQNITYVRNPDYWQPGRPYIDKILFPAYTSNPPANLDLSRDPGDWGGQFMPSIQSYYIAKDPQYRHYWFPPASNNDVFINLTRAPLSARALRQAMVYAIDKQRVSLIGEYGYEPPADQTGVLLPVFGRWYDKALADSYGYRYDPQKAISLLQQAGFTRGSSGIFQTKDGKPLSFSMIVIAGNTDSVACVKIVSDDLRKVGIDVKIEALSGDAFNARLFTGDYDLAWSGVGGGITPYYELRNLLDSANTAPIGKTAATNWERYRSAEADGLFDAFAHTTDSAKQRKIMDQIENVMLRDVPVIPVVQGVWWFQWSDRVFVGWPTPQNPYANPCPYCAPDLDIVINNLHLR